MNKTCLGLSVAVLLAIPTGCGSDDDGGSNGTGAVGAPGCPSTETRCIAFARASPSPFGRSTGTCRAARLSRTQSETRGERYAASSPAVTRLLPSRSAAPFSPRIAKCMNADVPHSGDAHERSSNPLLRNTARFGTAAISDSISSTAAAKSL